jgi:hypothetical protein
METITMARALAKSGPVEVTSPNISEVHIRIKSTAMLVQHKFSSKQRIQMMANMATPKSGKKSKSERAPRDYDSDFQNAQHKSAEGWNGIPASAFRIAMIDACRTIGVVMTRTKMALWILADGSDEETGMPLVRIHAKKPERTEMPVRNDNGSADIRVRPMWREWHATVRVQFDADMIDMQSVINLLNRAGLQVGVCEGRPFSKNSAGMGWGTFAVLSIDNPKGGERKPKAATPDLAIAAE